MKKVLLVLVLALAPFAVANAQKKGWTASVWYQAGNGALSGHSEMRTADLVLAPGYAFNRHLFVRLHGELSIGLFDVAPVKTYEINELLGISAGCNIADWGYWGLLEGAVTVGNTLFSENWPFTYYDAAIRWNIFSQNPTKLSFGLGVRYHQSHSSDYPGFYKFYVGIGFRFN